MIRKWQIRTIGAAAVTAAAAACADGAAASTGTDPCGNTVTYVQPFLRWLDPDTYVAVPGGSFENTAPAFALAGGAKIVGGNEPWSMGGKSLSLPAGASALSPAMCVGVFYPTIRMFATNSGSPASALRVDVLYTSKSGVTSSLLAGRFYANGTWQPSPILTFLSSAFGQLNGIYVNFKLTVEGSGNWKVDDLLVDPVKHR